MWLTVLQIVLGTVVAIGLVVFIEFLRRPKLEIVIADPSDQHYTDDRPATHARYLNLLARNRPLPRWASWMQRGTAMQCLGMITFHHLNDGQDVFGRSMPVRWSRLPEPVPVPYSVGAQTFLHLDPTAMTTTPRVDIYPGESEPFNVAARFDDDPECYGWSNENYFCQPPWRNENWRLESGRYLAKITITSSGQKCVQVVRIISDVSRQDFRLTPASAEDIKKVRC